MVVKIRENLWCVCVARWLFNLSRLFLLLLLSVLLIPSMSLSCEYGIILKWQRMLLAGGIVHLFIHEVLLSSFWLELLYFEHSFKCWTKWAPPYSIAYILTGETHTTHTQLRTTKNKLLVIVSTIKETHKERIEKTCLRTYKQITLGERKKRHLQRDSILGQWIVGIFE